MDELKAIVDEYVKFRKSEDYHEDNDYIHYIFEASLEKYYGRNIWKEFEECQK